MRSDTTTSGPSSRVQADIPIPAWLGPPGPWYGPTSPDFVDPWVRRQMEGFLAGLGNEGSGEGGGVNPGGSSSGGGGGTGGTYNSDRGGSLDPTPIVDPKAIKKQQLLDLLTKKWTANPCDKVKDPDCCDGDQLAILTDRLLTLFENMRENGFGSIADCLQDKIFNDKAYNIRCPNDSPFYYKGIHFDDPEWDEFIHQSESTNTLIFPDVMIDIDDGLYSLMSILGACEYSPSFSLWNTMSSFVMLGKVPKCYQLREMVIKHLQEMGLSYGEYRKIYDAFEFSYDGRTFKYYLETGKLVERVDGKEQPYSQWPRFFCDINE